MRPLAEVLGLLASVPSKFLCQGQMMLQRTGRHVSGAMQLASGEAGAAKQLGHVALHVAQGPKLWLRHYMVAVDVGPEACSR